MSSPCQPRALLTAGLVEAAARLKAGDLEAAAIAVEAVATACQACEAAGVTLSADELKEARVLFDRCSNLAATAEADLRDRLLLAGASGQARRRYSEP